MEKVIKLSRLISNFEYSSAMGIPHRLSDLFKTMPSKLIERNLGTLSSFAQELAQVFGSNEFKATKLTQMTGGFAGHGHC